MGPVIAAAVTGGAGGEMPATIGDRSLFPALEVPVYLNHAAVSPLSSPVQAAAERALRDVARLGMGAVGPAMEQRAALRVAAARLLGASPDDIGFPPGTTRGILDIALAIPWQPGDRVITFAGEFPSNVRPWLAVAERFGLTAEVLPLGDDGGRSALAEATRAGGRVRLVAVSAVQFQTGYRAPLADLAALTHAAGGELFVDAIQALGVTPLRVDVGVDYLVAGTHKWLMGLDGLAVAYASPAARARLQPLTAGWLSTESALTFLFDGQGHLRYDRPLRRSLDWVEGGVQTTAPFAALAASLEILEAIGVDRIFAHVQAWHDRCEPGLVDRGFVSGRAADPAARSGTLSLRPPVPLAPLARALAERGIAASTPDGWLRLAPHWPNALSEVDAVLAAVDDALAALR